ncbi:MAG: ParA family protein [Candidatus Woesearchaeota archaeon]
MRYISIINQKGGVAKTTTAINLAAGLSRNNRKVLLIDFDPQGNSSFSLDWKSMNDLHDYLIDNIELSQCVTKLGKNLDILGTKENLSLVEQELTTEKKTLKNIVNKFRTIKGYDYIIFDCSPVVSFLNEVAILSTKEAIVPSSTDVLGLRGTSNTLKMIEKINKKYDHELKVIKIVPTLYDQRNKICKKTLEIMNNIYYDLISDPIRINSKLKEAPEKRMSIFNYAKNSRGAEDYGKLVTMILNDEVFKKKEQANKEASIAITA